TPLRIDSLRNQVQAAYRGLTAPLARAPELDLLLMAQAEWRREDKIAETVESYAAAVTDHLDRARRLLAELRDGRPASFLSAQAARLDELARQASRLGAPRAPNSTRAHVWNSARAGVPPLPEANFTLAQVWNSAVAANPTTLAANRTLAQVCDSALAVPQHAPPGDLTLVQVWDRRRLHPHTCLVKRLAELTRQATRLGAPGASNSRRAHVWSSARAVDLVTPEANSTLAQGCDWGSRYLHPRLLTRVAELARQASRLGATEAANSTHAHVWNSARAVGPPMPEASSTHAHVWDSARAVDPPLSEANCTLAQVCNSFLSRKVVTGRARLPPSRILVPGTAQQELHPPAPAVPATGTNSPAAVTPTTLAATPTLSQVWNCAGAVAQHAPPADLTLVQVWDRRRLYLHTRLLKRDIALSNPLLSAGGGCDKLLFCKRVPTSYSHLVMQYYGWRARPGGGLFALEQPGVSLAARDILRDQLPPGNVLEPRLSYDARRIVFSYVRCPDGPLKPGDLSVNEEGPDEAYYHIYEVNVDGTGLRQLTSGPYDDLMPTYLPDGGIAFCSTRRRGYSRCFGPQFSKRWDSYTVHRMDRDGVNIRPLSFNDVSEWFPAVSNSGHILYARWDYIDRDAVTHQNLWAMRPDGSNPVAVWGNASPKPHCLFQAKPIPGSQKIVFTASAHHSITGGPICILDPTVDSNSLDAVARITPGPFPEAEGRPTEYYDSPWP
ncbi:MAG: hypothetical protein FJ272_14480, partial [Planctomycetes bacterium]|nr:hypothetical protein [Planctomycetota bacterium]